MRGEDRRRGERFLFSSLVFLFDILLLVAVWFRLG